MARNPALIGSSLVAFGLAAGLTTPGAAHAQTQHINWVSPGVMLSVSLGDKLAFGIGIDVRYSVLLKGTTSECSGARAGLGFFGQATWLNFSAGRFAAGIHGGGDILDQRPVSFDTEVGWTYRTGFDDAHPGGHGIHVGLDTVAASIIDLSVRGTIPWPDTRTRPEVTIGLGARFPATFGQPGYCVIGRPLRVGDSHALPGVLAARRRGSRPARLDAFTRAALASAWGDDARGECASIPAFLALARDLIGAGAPAELVRRSLASAEDEVRHTGLCAALAGAHGDMDILPELLPAPPRSGMNRKEEILRLAIESWEDGCMGEGAAAERACRQAMLARDEDARAALHMIAADEARHAELGWSIVAWCLEEGGRPVREALAEAVATCPEGQTAAPDADVDAAAWRAHGRIGRGEIEASWASTRAEARRRAERLIGSA